MERQLDEPGDDENEDEDLRRVDERGHHDALPLLAAAAAVFAEVRHMRRGAAAANAVEKRVHGEPGKNREEDLEPHHPAEKGNRHLLGEENGNQLVGSREEHGHEGARRDHAPRVQRGRRRREATLGHNARGGPEERAPLTNAPELSLERIARVRLHPLEDQIGREEEWKQQQVF